jgi:exopolysaccharide biosynthesis polyprenyl glycosylphosphotransferase
MTPQLGRKLMIHESAAGSSGVAVRPNPWLAGVSIAPESRRLALVPNERVEGSRLRRDAFQRRLLAAADVVAAAAALWLVLTVSHAHGPPSLAALIAMPLVVLVFKLAGLYDREQLRVVNSTLDEAPLLAQLTGLYVLSVAIAQPVLVDESLSGGKLVALWSASFVGVMGARILARGVAKHRIPVERCLVIGERSRADRIREKLASSRAHAEVIATFPLEGSGDIGPLDGESLRRLVSDLRIHRIIIAPTTTDSGGIVELIRIVKAAGAQVSVLPRMLEVVGSAVEFEDVDGMTMLSVRPFGLSRSSRMVKRGFDLMAGSIALLSVAPIIAAIAIAIRLDSRGPILFRQVRVGRDGREFSIFKFRSMVVDADAQKDHLRAMSEVGAGMFKITNDPRITRVGDLLRRTSLDELPQLFNVVRGEMSLVGPRPLVTDEDAQVLGLDRSRLHLTPGMTGPWQVLGARVPMQEMVGIDYLYVSNWSLWLDTKLLIRTVRHVLRGSNV